MVGRLVLFFSSPSTTKASTLSRHLISPCWLRKDSGSACSYIQITPFPLVGRTCETLTRRPASVDKMFFCLCRPNLEDSSHKGRFNKSWFGCSDSSLFIISLWFCSGRCHYILLTSEEVGNTVVCHPMNVSFLIFRY